MNLLNNAIDALRESTQVPLTITIRTFVEDENWIRVSIADNGVGIPANDRQ